jgi:NAD(P)-dependent dehydrogenase (short-subunit alcohol dehydrogenase family)
MTAAQMAFSVRHLSVRAERAWSALCGFWIITGPSSGIGLKTARVPAQRGATVKLACRSTGRAQVAARAIARTAPGATVELQQLGLCSLGSV